MLQLTDETPGNGNSGVHIINVAATDEAGVLIPDFDGVVTFKVEKVRILGVGNGDPNGHQPDIADTVPLFNGRGQIILAGENGKVTASCEGLVSSQAQW